jgi:hypothetical protein
MTPEDLIVLGCMQLDITPEQSLVLREQLSGAIEWDRLLQIADRQGTLSLLSLNLKQIGSDLIPTFVLDALLHHDHLNALSSLSLTQELLFLLKQFNTEEIRAIPFKGPILAQTLYNNLALRHFGDLDLLIHEDDVAKASAVLEKNGYRPTVQPDWAQNFCHSDRHIHVDLHWGLTQPYMPVPIVFDQLWQRRKMVLISDIHMPSLSIEDLLMVLVVQVAKDSWDRRLQLIKVCDLAMLVRSHPTLNWSAVFRDAQASGSIRIMLFALNLARQLFGLDLPHHVLSQIDTDPTVISLTQQVYKKLFRKRPNSMSMNTARRLLLDWREQAESLVFYLRLRERWQDQIPCLAYRAQVAFAPNEKDWAMVSLPNFLSILYYPLRLFRLIMKYWFKPLLSYGWMCFCSMSRRVSNSSATMR